LLPESTLPESTIKAYLEADYRVTAAEPFVLNIGRASPELALRLKLERTDGAAFITAWNPCGEQVSDTENRAAQQRLLAEIKALGFACLDGEGRDPSGRWPAEPSFLVFGISLEAAKKLAGQFHQNGFVYAGSDATPRLVLLR
jgi:hypothetical protein